MSSLSLASRRCSKGSHLARTAALTSLMKVPPMSDRQVVEFTCPECRGPVSRIVDEGPPQYRCLVGHAYSARLFLEAHYDTEERQLWAAALALEEAAIIARTIGNDLPDLKGPLEEAGALKRRQAEAIKAVIEQLRPFPTE